MLSIAAFSDEFQKHELVDAMHHLTPGTYYGLNLPSGNYDLVVFADLDGNGTYESHELIGRQSLHLKGDKNAPKVMGNVDIALGHASRLDWPVALKVEPSVLSEQSLFFPPNTIRTLDDHLFDPDMSALGMYHPAAFLEKAGTMFYALEEDIAYKIPVIFVHGIDGSARDFSEVLKRLDRTRFKPWFFHYPSGGKLDQMADFFFNIFLSGRVIPADPNIPVIVVAHSMGGLVVREALNKLEDDYQRKTTFISIASPFGGMAAAESGERNGLLVIPSWRDLNPANSYIKNLYRKPLPSAVTHKLVYAFGNPGVVKVGENSDGVVPLSSQLHKMVQQQASEQKGFNASHVGILRDPEAIDYLMGQINPVNTLYPQANMSVFLQGGFDQALGSHYSKREIYYLRHYGKFMRALVQRQVEPLNSFHQDILDAASGKRSATTEHETAWLKFAADYPEEAKTLSLLVR
ncbi:MAG: DUF413 domain-containing protein [Pseudomonadota bacterium]